VGTGRSVRAEEAYVAYLSIDKVGLEIVEGLRGVETGLTIVIGKLGDEAEVQVV
jgi:hypothetical protein